MTEQIQAYYEELHQSTAELLYRFEHYDLNPNAGKALEAISSEHARLSPDSGSLQEEALMKLVGMRSRLLTLMEDVLYTV
ncbi:hypothetical protein VE23_17785 [Paenibacillus sp. D9]|uniref:hypothetical protein n=1 Tax=Paenibacillus sp. D9 TaxID=665792 RepID=UPI0006201C97|nr:hypothetical protein [Paenibacillus sp. D9]KKC48518.1 hypothetical protein VE23_17785 [Paenibacillus sp. D9]